jgi:hypothetical protein
MEHSGDWLPWGLDLGIVRIWTANDADSGGPSRVKEMITLTGY